MTLRQVIAECEWPLALIMVIAALECPLLALLGVPMITNAVTVGLMGPGACATAVILRWRRMRRRGR